MADLAPHVLMPHTGGPGHIRTGSGPEFVAHAVQAWIRTVDARTVTLARPMLPL